MAKKIEPMHPVAVLIVLAVIIFVVVKIATSHGGHPNAIGTSNAVATSEPAPIDLTAAEGCQAFAVFVEAGFGNATDSERQDVIAHSSQMLKGAAEAEASGKAQPKYATLGANLIQATGDINTGDVTTAAFKSETDEILSACFAIPSDAKTAAGYNGTP